MKFVPQLSDSRHRLGHTFKRCYILQLTPVSSWRVYKRLFSGELSGVLRSIAKGERVAVLVVVFSVYLLFPSRRVSRSQAGIYNKRARKCVLRENGALIIARGC